jgi:hypothetical protein
MQRVDSCPMNERLPPERAEAVSFSHAPVVRRSQGGEAPPLLAGYLERISQGGLLAREEELSLGRRARAADTHPA